MSVVTQTQKPSRLEPAFASSHRLGTLTLLDCVLLGFLSLFLVAVTIYRSRTRLLWADELLCYQLFADPSFAHRLHAWYKGADGGGVLYYLLGSLWFRLFPLSELSLRLFSTAGMAAGMVLLWVALRRYVNLTAAAAAVGVAFFLSPAMLWQEVNGRFYGLFFACAALAGLMFLAAVERHHLSVRFLCAVTLAHASLVASHIFGLIFSVSLILGLLVVDRLRGRLRWKLYVAAGLGWLPLAASWPSIRASTVIIGRMFWTRRPTFGDLLYSFVGHGRLTASIVSALVCAALLRLLMRRNRPQAPVRRPVAPFALAASLLLAGLLFFLRSQTGISIFSDRYLLPLSLATAFLVAGCVTVLLPRSVARAGPAPSLVASLLVLIPCCWYGFQHPAFAAAYPTRAYVHAATSLLRPGVPAVAEIPIFTLLHIYDPTKHYLFLTDWDYANDPRHPSDYSGERLMENWQRAGYLADDILPCTTIFTRYPRVDLLLGFHLTPWFRDRILTDPHLHVTHVGTVPDWNRTEIYTVDRLTPGPPPC